MTLEAAKKYPRRIPRRAHTPQWDETHRHRVPKGNGEFAKVRKSISGEDLRVVSDFIENMRKKGSAQLESVKAKELAPEHKFEIMGRALKVAEKVRKNAAQYSQNGRGQVVGEFLLLCSELEMYSGIGRITPQSDASLLGNQKWERVRELLLELESVNAP